MVHPLLTPELYKRLLIEQGMRPIEIARLLGINPKRLNKWASRRRLYWHERGHEDSVRDFIRRHSMNRTLGMRSLINKYQACTCVYTYNTRNSSVFSDFNLPGIVLI